MDADKQNYLNYAKKLLPHLKSGGLMVADNAVNYAHLMRDFISFAKTDKNLESFLVEIDNGILLIVKR